MYVFSLFAARRSMCGRLSAAIQRAHRPPVIVSPSREHISLS